MVGFQNHGPADSRREDLTMLGSESCLRTCESAVLRVWRSFELPSDQPVVVAFSGGGDSTALLLALTRLTQAGRPLSAVAPIAVHLDHNLDRDSASRCLRARAIAQQLGVRFLWRRCHQQELATNDGPSRSTEALARETRYRFLERVRKLVGGSAILTAHHRQDQLETLLLRLSRGTGLVGLGGIRPRSGRVVRPLLGLEPSVLSTIVDERGLDVCADPTNSDLRFDRNRLRQTVLPLIVAQEPHLMARAEDLAGTVRRVLPKIRHRLAAELDFRQADLSLDLRRLKELPHPLWSSALRVLHLTAGRSYPASRSAEGELQRQLNERHHGQVDCGAGWRWHADGDRLRLVEPMSPERTEPRPPPVGFAYRLTVPGKLWIPELQRHFCMAPGSPADWMFRRSSQRAGLRLPLRSGDQVVIRTRLPGDRLQPFGCSGTKKLKAVLIDSKVPRPARDTLPLLSWRDNILWVPGITIEERCRIPRADADQRSRFETSTEADRESSVWIAEWSRPPGSSASASSVRHRPYGDIDT